MLTFSQAAENNKEPIAEILREAFKDTRQVLEIASGTGQHAAHFGACFPHLTWQPSDLTEHIGDIAERLSEVDLPNVLPPVVLDVATHTWPVCEVDGIFSANCVHIVSWDHVEQMFRGIGKVLVNGAVICLYGPYKYDGSFTTESNARFDEWLKSRDPMSGLRDFEAVDRLAQMQGFSLERDVAMPANNQLLIWRRGYSVY